MALAAVRDGFARPTRGLGSRPRQWGARRSRRATVSISGRVRLALHAQDPAHDVNALRVPARDRCRDPACGRWRRLAAPSAPRRCAAGFRGAPGTCKPGKDSRRWGSDQGPASDGHGERLEVAEGTPFGIRESKAAGPLLNIGAHRLLPRDRLAARRGTRSPAEGLSLPVLALPRGAGNARARRWKPSCCGARTDGGTWPERAGYARKRKAAAMAALGKGLSPERLRRPRGEVGGFRARSGDRRSRQ